MTPIERTCYWLATSVRSRVGVLEPRLHDAKASAGLPDEIDIAIVVGGFTGRSNSA